MTTIYYRTKDGQADYGFSIEQQPDGSWRLYIVRQPSYGTRAADGHSTHRYTDADGRHYICWSNALWSETEARTIAALWADQTQKYIATGNRF